MGGDRADRFTWERAIRSPKAGMPHDLLCLALVLATYSTGKTGGDIEVSEAELCAVLGYRNPRTVRRLMAELRDGYRVIERTGGGNRYAPVRYVLVLPADLARRAGAVRDGRAADRARASKRPKADGFRPGAPRPVKEVLDRAHSGSRPGAEQPYTGRSAPPYQDQDQETPLSPLPPGANRAALAGLGADEREIDYILDKISSDPAVRSPTAYLRAALANGDGPTLLDRARAELARVPCDTTAPGRHSEACRRGDGRDCGMGWCECRCHEGRSP
jgi:hypothetical protein